MYEIKDVAQELKEAAKRRRFYLIFTPILFLIAVLLSLYFIEPKYKASTTIMVQKDQMLNPLVLYKISEDIPEKDELQSLYDIIYNRSTINFLIDSLDLNKGVSSKMERQQLIEKIQSNIGVRLKSSDTFEISYFDNKPVRAKNGSELLVNHYIKKKLEIESRKHQETVDFFSNRLAQLDTVVKEQRSQTVSITSNRLQSMPSNSEALQERLQSINSQLDTIERQLFNEEEKLKTLKAFQGESNIKDGINHLYKLPLTEMQFGEDLVLLLKEYDDLRQQFTESYPKLGSLAEKIKQVADRMPPVLTSNIQSLKSQKQDLLLQKQKVIKDMQQFFIETERANSQKTDFNIYEGLQADLKVKLEQAKMIRDIGEKAAEQFIVLEEAIIPKKPVSPNKLLIIGVGLVLGVIMGIVASAVAEVMDTTIRDETDLPVDKPIIAYLTTE